MNGLLQGHDRGRRRAMIVSKSRPLSKRAGRTRSRRSNGHLLPAPRDRPGWVTGPLLTNKAESTGDVRAAKCMDRNPAVRPALFRGRRNGPFGGDRPPSRRGPYGRGQKAVLCARRARVGSSQSLTLWDRAEPGWPKRCSGRRPLYGASRKNTAFAMGPRSSNKNTRQALDASRRVHRDPFVSCRRAKPLAAFRAGKSDSAGTGSPRLQAFWDLCRRGLLFRVADFDVRRGLAAPPTPPPPPSAH